MAGSPAKRANLRCAALRPAAAWKGF